MGGVGTLPLEGGVAGGVTLKGGRRQLTGALLAAVVTGARAGTARQEAAEDRLVIGIAAGGLVRHRVNKVGVGAEAPVAATATSKPGRRVSKCSLPSRPGWLAAVPGRKIPPIRRRHHHRHRRRLGRDPLQLFLRKGRRIGRGKGKAAVMVLPRPLHRTCRDRFHRRRPWVAVEITRFPRARRGGGCRVKRG